MSTIKPKPGSLRHHPLKTVGGGGGGGLIVIVRGIKHSPPEKHHPHYISKLSKPPVFSQSPP